MRKSIFVTGAASGIGRATATLFAQRGWFVGAYDVDARGLETLATDLGVDAGIFAPLDVTDRDAVQAAFTAFGEATGGRLDLLFNNAGIDAKGPFADMAWSQIVKVIDINLIGGVSVIHAAFPLLKATGNSLCLSTASASAIFGQANLAIYSATKHAVKGLTEALSVEFAAYGVRAADILPGIIDTGMLDPAVKATLPSEGILRPLPPADIAEAAWSAYHGSALHLYVPAELAQLEIAIATDPESVRDRRVAGAIF